ncbi:hypothetical protein JR316_0002020 [Psilocybe cubensis]|uniref:Uncharacterized protein n=2 Tax=Psilocybe cubensis TaxID=181762 RepID=A0A8H7Y4Z9_PSICU|nr:hypothetical protein JR316_0002020 [Psilocybe cubensis]KAH9485113.1 hypothetical protein JR316_0002020 [Psilocybe cubensis]
MNVTFYTSEFTSQVSQIPILTIPGTIWAYYLEYLWFYEPDSWVATIAYSCRVLAVLISLPVIILGLLDIASYGIARTLGVVDDVKASTSDKATVHLQTPSIMLNGAISPASDSAFSDSDSGVDHNLHNKMRSPLSDSISEANDGLSSQPPAVFYAGESSLKLSGVGVFSPAASLPPSPTLSRRDLTDLGSESLRHRKQHAVQMEDVPEDGSKD